MDIGSILSLAVKHHEAGRLQQAETLYRQILETQQNHADALHLLGVLYHQSGQTTAAVDLIDRAIVENPHNPHYYVNLGNALRANGKADAAVDAYQRALDLNADLALAHLNLGVTQHELGKPSQAADAYRRVIDIQPNHAIAHYNLGTAFKDLGNLDAAIAALRQASELDPQSIKTHVVLSGYLLEQGDSTAALATCDHCLRLDPGNRLALAFKTVALNELGRHDDRNYLLDFDRLMTLVKISEPAGFAGLREFNEALGQHIRTHPSLITRPSSGATRFGSHTEELLVEPKGPFSFLEGIIDNAVEGYLRSLPTDHSHPYLGRSITQWQLSVWGVVLKQQGHQLAHMHPDGWVSGVYYVKLPPAIGKEPSERAGWIEFGGTPAEFRHTAAANVKAIQPQEGLLILFPSYFYHQTVPFTGTEERISVAFDVVPKF